MNKVENFGIVISSVKYDFELSKKDLLCVNNKTSLPLFCEALFLWYENFGKEFCIDYLEKLLKFYNSQEDLTPKQEYLQYKANELLAKIKRSRRKYIVDKRYLDRAKNYDLSKSIEGRIYSKQWCDRQLKEVEENYNNNLRYFEHLDEKEFEDEIDKFLKENKSFKEITDLKPYMSKSGYYVMVLGKYKQVYVGTTDDIGRRIVQHWRRRKHFDRLIFPWHAVSTSKLPIDAFQVLDTSRIFVYTTKKIYEEEDKFINSFNGKFVLNRVIGGEMPILPLEKESLVLEDE